jgi:CYTH domain-containing protein
MRLDQRLSQAMDEAREDVRSAFDRIDAKLRRRLEVMRVRIEPDETPPGPRFGEALADKAREEVRALAEGLRQVHSSEDRSLCHASRIAGKRLRYLLEPVQSHAPRAARIVKRCKQLQDLLGDLNDAHVLSEELGEAFQLAASERARLLHELARGLDDEPMRRAARRSERPGLVELTQRVQRRIGGLFERLEKDWLVRGLDELVEDVEQLATELPLAHPGVEIERKYLLRALPELGTRAEVLDVEQGWLPGERLRERIRRTRSHGRVSYFRTVKLGAGVSRIEIEEATTRDVFEALWPLTAGCRVHKRRHAIRDGKYLWEIDEFIDQELVLAEVELSRADEVPALPGWLAPLVEREVTDDPSYTNLSLAH